MENLYIFPGSSSDEIENLIENDSDIKEGNKNHYIFI
jgi:hypothetical protein